MEITRTMKYIVKGVYGTPHGYVDKYDLIEAATDDEAIDAYVHDLATNERFYCSFSQKVTVQLFKVDCCKDIDLKEVFTLLESKKKFLKTEERERAEYERLKKKFEL